MSEIPAVRFLRTLCAAVLREVPAAEASARAHAALGEIWSSRKSLVLEVQFTGFVSKGERIGSVEPLFLRAAGQLIGHGVNRVGFTPDVREEDLATLFDLAVRPRAELGGEGIVGALRTAAPRGIFVSTASGGVYKPTATVATSASEPGAPASVVAAQATATAPVPAAECAAPARVTHPAASAPAPAPENAPATPAPQPAAPALEPTESARVTIAPQPAVPALDATASAPAAPAPQPTALALDSAFEQGLATPPALTAPSAETNPTQVPAAPEAAALDLGASVPPADAPQALTPFMDDDGADLAAFEFVEDVDELSAAPAAAQPPAAEAARPEEPSATDMYHFFRASSGERAEEESERLPALLREAENMSRFDELAESCARNALRHLRAGDHLVAASLLDVLATEAERSDRTRLFRESAETALRGIGTAENLPHLLQLLQLAPGEREKILHVLFYLGGEAVAQLETQLSRAPDAELRRAIFRRFLRGEGGGRAAVSRALADTPPRARAVLELLTIPEVDPEQAGRWIGEAAAHAEPAVRTDAARAAATLGGRTGMRILVDLLADGDRAVRRAALHGLASMQDSASVPFLTRFLNENGDDDLQLAAIAALGRTGSAEAIPTLLAIVNKRQLFGGRKAKALKLAAVEAIGLTGVPAARDALTSISTGSDADLATEARRALTNVR